MAGEQTHGDEAAGGVGTIDEECGNRISLDRLGTDAPCAPQAEARRR